MKLLYDELRKYDVIGLEEYFNQAYVFNVDNVAEYYYQSKQVEWDFRTDFPAITPPFPITFFEYSPPTMGVFAEGTRFIPTGLRFGLLIIRHDITGQGNLKWILECVLFGTQNNSPYFIGCMRLAVDDRGKWKPLPGLKDSAGIQFLVPGEDASISTTQAILSQHVRPVFLAISFLHCKNVKTVPQGAGMNIGKRNRHAPCVRYHILNIEPMKQILKIEGNSETVGLKTALHICRGHFKDYRETGLFGKLHDIYWWESHVRGTRENGVVLKDYKINQPKFN